MAGKLPDRRMSCIRSIVTSAGCLLFLGCMSKELPEAADADPQIIPRPNVVETSPGAFRLQRSTTVIARDADARWIGTWLVEQLKHAASIDLRSGDENTANTSDIIRFELGGLPESASREAYRLTVSPEKILVTANDSAGLFYGAVSVWQLATANAGSPIPAMTIDDAPRFAWRGLMLDVARHYVSPQFIKQMIDWMALHKLNVLHWHLTDDQGWRLEIDAYPRLTAIGAWRTPAGRAALDDVDPQTGKPRQYGAFYTREEVRDIVAYAAERHVTIVPEIEMPGHAQAAIAAYPEFGVDDARPAVSADWGIHNYLFNVEESTFEALEVILGEVLELFPGQYIHVGGDEAMKEQWIASPRVQQRMRELGVGNETELQSYFVKRIEAFLREHGRRLIGWDEILEGGIAPEATVMSWRGIDGAIEAARLGHDAVLSPWPVLYFDNRQSGLASEPPGRGSVVSLEDVYRFDPMPQPLAHAGEEHVLGLQANLWSEHIRTEERLAYMAFPRAAAVAEVAWSQPERLDWTHFAHRLADQFDRYRLLGIPFATSAFDVQLTARHDAAAGVAVELSNQSGIGDIRYTLDGNDVTAESARYAKALTLPAEVELRAATFLDDRQMSHELRTLAGRMARRRFSQELKPCTEKLVLSLEDDAPIGGDRSVFLIDVMNPCWIWEDADLSAVTRLEVAVGQVPFNFQLGSDRDAIRLPEPASAAGELQVRAGGCDGTPVAVLPLQDATRSDAVSVLATEFSAAPALPTDLCFRFTAGQLDPMWAIDWIELLRAPDPGAAPGTP
jgi:hexosaminidase